MNRTITIVGSGFAAQQLVRSLRKRDTDVPIRMITADNGDEYNKPDLSHVASRAATAAGMPLRSGEAFAAELGITLQARCRVEAIDPVRQVLVTSQGECVYEQLVLATGARAVRPAVAGSHLMHTLNSLEEFARLEPQLAAARSVLVLGAGLIGTELAMDIASTGREVTLVDIAQSPLSALLPAALSQPLINALQAAGVRLQLGRGLHSIEKAGDGLQVNMSDGSSSHHDLVLAAIGLAPEVSLARDAGIDVGRGIIVDEHLRTSVPDIYALGDGMEFQGTLLPFLQPALLGATVLAATLLGKPTPLVLPHMMVRVKTPAYVMQMAGRTRGEGLSWQSEWNASGMLARSFDAAGKLCGFVVGGDRISQAFAVYRELPRLAA
ncbi:NADH:flavorubredoxin reductase NorW [Paraburkholderia dinghuensis]|uniref:NADH:flavorubredoxin reductase NorW n=1 Tax=Paraburkholderia dinghuensis TaxID=2305225 RepID=A0A3N6P477_9BURK|nr:NADH:flavorubredoxin reductase NorW [Paraburkholderia dinghuensis]RQH08443.1 NADH:flavorubredoxin reductase NorW [Paraburkholderia dinghuensis]